LQKNKNKGYEIQRALHNIDFAIEKGEFFGIVGRNGSGKSTLLKILAGIYQPTEGSVETNGRLVPFIELGVGFNPELTGRENVYLNGALLGFSRAHIDAMYNDIVAFAELEDFMDQQLKNYSSGMQVRLAFSVATRAEADILLVDEVLAVGDAAFQRKCFEYFKQLKATNKTVIFVTHDMNAVREYCDRALLIEKSEIKQIGHPQDIAREYSLLFMEDKVDHTKKENDKRWGNGDATITNVNVNLKDNKVLVDVDVAVKKAIDKMIYGIHIFGEDGEEITAVNNRMIQLDDVTKLKPGMNLSFSWDMLNIFNDGNYFITLTLVDDVANTLDWYVEAATFTVKRMDRSTTPVLPPITVKTTTHKRK
jgi:ABC-2 type transport system ATP-binding protein